MEQLPFHIDPAARGDYPQIVRLLTAAGLTREGIEDCEFSVARDTANQIIGVVGLETWGTQGLLRSLAVEKIHRGKGVGRELVLHTIHQACAKKLDSLFLITEAVKEYYFQFGFKLIKRDQVAGPVLNSAEFRGSCLVSADVMQLTI